MPWAYPVPLCNNRTMTAGLSYHCQRVIARCHLTVKGFPFEWKAHCDSAQVMRLFLYIHSNTKCKPLSISVQILHPRWFFACSRLHTSRNLCRCMTHFSFPCIRGTISIVCAVKTIAPLKISRLIGLIQYSRLKVLASLEQHFLIIIASGGLDVRFPFWGGSTHSRKHLKIYPCIRLLKYSLRFKAHLNCVPFLMLRLGE